MKKVLPTILFILCAFVLKADYFEVDAFNKVVSVSNLAKEGKISIFIISTKWCSPCHKLRNDLLQANFDMNEIDIWYISMSGKHNYGEVKKTNAYFSWRVYERIEEWPFVYITSPTTNVYKKISEKTLTKEGKRTSVLEEVLEKVKFLQKKAKEYPQLTDFDVLLDGGNIKSIPISKALEKYKLLPITEKTEPLPLVTSSEKIAEEIPQKEERESNVAEEIVERNTKKNKGESIVLEELAEENLPKNTTKDKLSSVNSDDKELKLSDTIELDISNRHILLTLPIQNKELYSSLWFSLKIKGIGNKGELTTLFHSNSIKVEKNNQYEIKNKQKILQYEKEEIIIEVDFVRGYKEALGKKYKGKKSIESEKMQLTTDVMYE